MRIHQVVCTTILYSVLAALTNAQSASGLVFEVASVKPSAIDSQSGSSTFNHGSLVVRSVPLRSCIAAAYQVKYADVQGPAWLDSARFDITAKAPATSTEPELMRMYQALLEDRFKLRVRPGMKEKSGFALRIAKGGIKLRDVGPQPAQGQGQGTRRSNASNIVAENGMTMTTLARQLEMRLSVPVTDMTETSDYYVVDLQFTLPELSDRPDAPRDHPVLFNALEEQAGLHLESIKVTVPIIVVESVERNPTEN